jgi:hypothetical protein
MWQVGERFDYKVSPLVADQPADVEEIVAAIAAGRASRQERASDTPTS